jgi:hypothetical protein
MKWKQAALFIVLLVICTASSGYSQKMAFDAKFGLSFFTGNGSSSGILFGGGLDIPMDNKLYVRPELNITSHSGTPIELGGQLKYYLPSETKTNLYIDGGMGIWFHSGGSSLGLDFGGGTIFPLHGSDLSIPAEIRLGPIFNSGSTTFQIAITSGIRFNIP